MVNSDVKGDVPKNTREAYAKIRDWIDKDSLWRSNCLNMIASENIISPAVKSALTTDFEGRYAEGRPGDRFYQGTWMFDEIEIIGEELFKRLFGAVDVDLMPKSGTGANFAVVHALSSLDDLVMSLRLEDGAHISHTKVSTLGYLRRGWDFLPFDPELMNIDVDASTKKIRERKPKMVFTGGSVFLFPHPLRELSEACEDAGSKLVYDGAHVAGLIAGGEFQEPLKEGADLMTFSTHKTFPGPQGGAIIFANNGDSVKKIKKSVFPGVTSNHHLHHVVGKAIAAAEMLEFGADYASQILRNSKALAEELSSLGVSVVGSDVGFTESHQILLDVSENGGGSKCAEDLERSNIIVSKQTLPWDSLEEVADPSGLRIGSQELTRLGMKEPEMKEVASLMKRVIVDKKDPRKIKEEVIELKKNFNTVKFCFEPGEAYKYLTK